VDDTITKRFRVMGLKAFDREFHRGIVLQHLSERPDLDDVEISTNQIRQRKIGHVENYTSSVHWGAEHQAGSFHNVDVVPFQAFLGLVSLFVKANTNMTNWSTFFVNSMQEAFSHAQLLHKPVVIFCDSSNFSSSNNTSNLEPNQTLQSEFEIA
jgi:hypothetical protein